MTDMKCPFCQQEVEKVEWQDGDIEICCSNCDITGSAKLWQELIRTRKALEISVDAMTQCSSMRGVELIETINAALAKIKDTIEIKTTLEQKD